MNRKWDSDKGGRDKWIAWLTEGMKECLRVLKPGGMALVWCIPRTAHWTATAIEDAGFEIRDKIYAITGQGFPKSLAIDKAMERQHKNEFKHVCNWLDNQLKKSGLKHTQIAEHFGFAESMVRHWLGKCGKQDAIPTWNQWIELKEVLKFSAEMDTEVWRLNGRKGKPGDAWYKRKVVGQSKSYKAHYGGSEAPADEFNITIPATPEAQRFSGYGTGLKPSVEEWVLAMKPLDGNFAENALRHNLAGLNIDGCRIKTEYQEERITKSNKPIYGGSSLSESKTVQTTSRDGSPTGRYPSNLLFSHSPECRETEVKKVKNLSGSVSGNEPSNTALNVYGEGIKRQPFDKHADKDGTETVPAYECAAGCPCGHVWATKELTECPECGCRKTEWICAVKVLDEQAGDRSSTRAGGNPNNPIHQVIPGQLMSWGGIRETHDFRDSGGPSRFYYCAKSSRTEREQGLKGHIPCVKCGGLDTDWHTNDKGEKVKCVRNDHPTVKSLSIMEYLCRLTQTPDGGVVLDPFLGSGTTGVACIKTGRKFIGIDNDPRYVEISRWAMEHARKRSRGSFNLV